MISRVAFVIVLDCDEVIDCALRCRGVGEKNRLCRVLGCENVHAVQKPPTLDDVYVCLLHERLNAFFQATAFEVRGVSYLDASYLAVMRLLNPCLLVMDYVIAPVLISCDEIEKLKDFDSSDVCLMANGVDPLACQSLACPGALDLCCVLVPPLENLARGIEMVSACDLDSVRAVYR